MSPSQPAKCRRYKTKDARRIARLHLFGFSSRRRRGGLKLCRGRSHRFAQESRRDGRRQHGPIVMLLHFQSIEKRFHIGIAARR